MPSITVASPLGPLSVDELDGAVVRLLWHAAAEDSATPVLTEAADQLAAYFNGDLKTFDLPLAPAGSAFEQAVWDLMLEIPLGEARTYGDMAADLTARGVAAAAQPVGNACGSNPIPVIIPCHRVVATGGGMGGYSGDGGLVTKRFLLEHENWPGVAPGPLFAAPTAG